MAALLEALWGLLARFGASIGAFFVKFWQKIWPVVATWVGMESARQAAKIPMRVAILGAWAIFLGAVFTGLTGMGVQQVFNLNPLTGVPAGVMYLLCSFFPLHFFFGLVMAYVTWRISIITAVQILNKTILFIFGPK
jgi:hypothetical protein